LIIVGLGYRANLVSSLAPPTRMKSERRFPPPWTAEVTPSCFIVRDSIVQALSYVYLFVIALTGASRMPLDARAPQPIASLRRVNIMKLVPVPRTGYHPVY
jgi:hypothetical protein